jgi:hypothetical protein
VLSGVRCYLNLPHNINIHLLLACALHFALCFSPDRIASSYDLHPGYNRKRETVATIGRLVARWKGITEYAKIGSELEQKHMRAES